MATPRTYAKTNIVKLAIKDLNPAEYNARLITEEALAGLGKSLETVGLLSFPVVNKRPDGSYRIVGGHQRIKVLSEKKVTKIPCIVVEFDDQTEREANFALNNRAIQGTFVPEMTRALLDQIRAATEENQPGVFDELRFNALLKTLPKIHAPKEPRDEEHDGRTDDEETPKFSKSSVDSKAGKYYKLGEHVLFVGRVDTVSILRGFPVERADIAFTRIAEKKAVTQEYLDTMLSCLIANTDGAIYIPTNLLTLPHLQRRFVALGGVWEDTLLWYPPDPAGSTGTVYRDVTIPVMYGWREGAPHYFAGKGPNVTKLKKQAKSDLPVEVITRCLLDASTAKSYVLDLDAGRGSTVIAAEKTNRRVIGFVKTATEMDVIRKRWTDFTQPPGANWQSVTFAI